MSQVTTTSLPDGASCRKPRFSPWPRYQAPYLFSRSLGELPSSPVCPKLVCVLGGGGCTWQRVVLGGESRYSHTSHTKPHSNTKPHEATQQHEATRSHTKTREATQQHEATRSHTKPHPGVEYAPQMCRAHGRRRPCPWRRCGATCAPVWRPSVPRWPPQRPCDPLESAHNTNMTATAGTFPTSGHSPCSCARRLTRSTT